MGSRKQDLCIMWRIAKSMNDQTRCECIENTIRKELKTAEKTIKSLKKDQ